MFTSGSIRIFKSWHVPVRTLYSPPSQTPSERDHEREPVATCLRLGIHVNGARQMSHDLLQNDIDSDDPLLSEPHTGLDPQYGLGPDALRRSWKRGSHRRRRLKMGVGLGLVALLLWLAISLGGALTNPALGSSLTSRVAEWARGHGGAAP